MKNYKPRKSYVAIQVDGTAKNAERIRRTFRLPSSHTYDNGTFFCNKLTTGDCFSAEVGQWVVHSTAYESHANIRVMTNEDFHKEFIT